MEKHPTTAMIEETKAMEQKVEILTL